MRSGTLLLAAVALAAFVGSATAKDEPSKETTSSAGAHPRYARSYAEAMAEAKERGCVVFVTAHEDG